MSNIEYHIYPPYMNISTVSSGLNDSYFNQTQDLANISCCNYSTSHNVFYATTQETEIPSKNNYILPWPAQFIYIFLFVSMVVIAAGGNLIVVWIVLAHKRMRTVTNYFLVNLAIADALMSILNTMFNFIYMLYSNWPFGKEYCKWTMLISPCTIAASVFTFMAIAIDRYMAIIHPLRPRMSAAKVLFVIAIIWIASVTLSFPFYIFADIHTFIYSNGEVRIVCYMNWQTYIDFGYNTFLMVGLYFIPLCILTGTYMRIGLELWGSKTIGEYCPRQDQNIKSKRKIVKTMIVVVIIFGICWLPQHVYFIVRSIYPALENMKFVQPIYLCIYWLAMSNSMYNPLIYCWMNARFREGFLSIFQHIFCLKYAARRKPSITSMALRTMQKDATIRTTERVILQYD